MKTLATHRASIALLFYCSACIGSASAATYSWQTTGANDTWSTAPGDSNWFIDAGTTLSPWTDGNAALFNATTDATITVSGTVAPTSVTFGNGWANNTTITGGTIAFGATQGSIDSSAVGTVGGRQIAIASALTGTGGLVLKGHGDLTLTGGGSGAQFQLGGNNSGLSGGISITGGLADLTTANALGANALTLNGGGIVNANHGALTFTNAVAVPGVGTVRAWGTAAFNLTGVLSGSGTLSKTDGGTLTLGSSTGTAATAVNTAANTFTGKFVAGGAGRLGITGDSALGAVPASLQADHLTLDNGILTNMSQATSATGFSAGFDVTLAANRGITLAAGGGTFQTGYNKTVTIGGPITGGGALTKSDNGTLVLLSDSTYTGTTTVTGGVLQLGNGGGSGSISNAALTVNGGSTLLVNRNAAVTLSQAFTLGGTAGNTNVSVADGAAPVDLTLSGLVSGTREFWKLGAGTLALTGVNTYTGSTVIAGGVLDLNTLANGATAGAHGTGGLYIAQAGTVATLRYSGSTATTDKIGPFAFQGTGANATVEIPNASTVLTVTSQVGENGAGKGFTKTGAGTLLFTAASTYTGPTVVNAGTLAIGNGGTGGTLGSGAVTNNSTLEINRSDALSIPNAISGTGTLVKRGSGTTTLAGAITYTGDTTVHDGTLAIGVASLADVAKVNLDGSGKLALNFTGSDTVSDLYIGGVPQTQGTWGATGSGATYIDDSRFSGTGTLTVTNGPTNAYEGWAALKGLTVANNARSADPDGDGCINLAEFAFAKDPLSGKTSGAGMGTTVLKVGVVNSQPALTLTVPLRSGASFGGGNLGELVSGPVDGVIYHLQASLDCANWTSLQVLEVTGTDRDAIQAGMTAAPSGWTNRTFQVPGADPAATTKCFIRAKVEEAP